MDNATKYPPRKLVKNRIFPTYQLHAFADNERTSAEEAMTIAILTTLDWLRKRFIEIQIPEEIIAPDPKDYKTVSLESFGQIHVDRGYTLDIVSMPEEKVWTLRLIEPDPGYRDVETGKEFPAVPGRLIETNMSYVISDGKLECGFKTLFSEPENCSAPITVFRPTVVKLLARNPLVGLKQEYKIQDNAFTITAKTDIARLYHIYTSGKCDIPFVVFSEKKDEPTDQSSFDSANDFIKKSFDLMPFGSLMNSAASKNIIFPKSGETPNLLFNSSKDSPIIEKSKSKEKPSKKQSPIAPKPYLPLDIKDISRYRMSFAFFFILSHNMINEFNNTFSSDIIGGDIAFIEPLKVGREIKAIHTSENAQEVLNDLSVKIKEYPAYKDVSYGNIVFHNAAMAMYYQKVAEKSKTIVDFAENCAVCKKAMKKDKEDAIAVQITHINKITDDTSKRISKLTSAIEQKDRDIERLKSENEDSRAKAEAVIDKLKNKIEYLESKEQRPDIPSDIPKWVSERFEGRMIFHDRAVSLISDVKKSDIDINLLCDALEFLASEYLDNVKGIISEDEMNTICSEKYKRPFDVAPLGDMTIEHTPSEYKIKYKIGFKGKPVETPLNLHLRVGNQSDNLLRIYFLYDEDKQLVVVGSLPWHLTNLQKF